MTDSIPSETLINQMLQDMVDYWQQRDDLVLLGRKHLTMENEVAFPDVAHFTPQKLLMGEVRAFVTERQAQFRPERVVSVIPFGISEEAQARSSRLERGINELLYWTSQRRDAWGKCIADAFVFEGAWERWEPSPYAAWPKLIIGEGDEHDKLAQELLASEEFQLISEKAFSDPSLDAGLFKQVVDEAFSALYEARKIEYKKSIRKLPLTNEYVPLENCFPAWQGDELDYVLEVEYRPLRAVVRNPLFDAGATARLETISNNRVHDVRNEIPIIRYCDNEWYAYFALAPGEDASAMDRTSPSATQMRARNLAGQPMLLHAYRHNVGRPLYNEVFGAFGGWSGGDWSYVAGRVKAMLGLAQARDELASQAMTIARNEAWGGYKITTGPTRPRTADNGEVNIEGLQGKLGEDIILYPDEKFEPIHPSMPNPFYSVITADVIQQYGKVSGSQILLGQHQPGTSTGFQMQQQIARAEGQFARVEQGITRSGANGIYLALEIIKAMGEPVYVMARQEKRGQQYYEHAVIDPKDLDPMPLLDVTISAPRPIDFTAALNDFRVATSVVGNNEPAMATNTAREKLLQIERPEEESMKIHAEQLEQKFWASDLPTQLMTEKLVMRLIADSTPATSQAAVNSAMNDPSFAGQMSQFASGAQPEAGAGGAPATMQPPLSGPPASEVNGVGQGFGGGMPTGSPEPMQTIGREQQVAQPPPPPRPQ